MGGDAEVDPFYGGKIREGFSNKNEIVNKALSLNLLLKSVLFACLFYILAHSDTKNFVIKRVFKNVRGLKADHYIYVAMILFFIAFYVLSLFL